MHREYLLQMLHNYREEMIPRLYQSHSCQPERDREYETIQQFEAFIRTNPHCFDKDNPVGHVTGSCLLVNPQMDRVVLTLHRKLGKWIQLGGHSDGEPYTDQVAMREAMEESGLTKLSFHPDLKGMPIDIDIHSIPAYQQTPAHLHYDVRFLILSATDDLKISEESFDLAWFSLEEAQTKNAEKSMLRQLDKIKLLQ